MAGPLASRPVCRILSGPDSGRRITGDEQVLILGSNAGTDGSGSSTGIRDPGVLPQHAVIWRSPDGRWRIEGLEPESVTHLNGARINQATVISPGDELKLGGTLMRFELDHAAPGQEEREQPSAPSSAEREDFDAIYAKARDLTQKNQYQEAKELFVKLLESPEYAEGAHYDLGVVYFTEKDYEKAKLQFARCVKLNHQNHNAFAALGETLLRQGRTEDAEEILRQAKRLGNQDAAARLEQIHGQPHPSAPSEPHTPLPDRPMNHTPNPRGSRHSGTPMSQTLFSTRVEGIASRVRQRPERYLTVLAFFLSSPIRESPIQVEMRTRGISGSVEEGNEVEVIGRWSPGGIFKARKIYNISTKNWVGPGGAHFNRLVPAVIVIIVALLLFFYVLPEIIDMFGSSEPSFDVPDPPVDPPMPDLPPVDPGNGVDEGS